MLDFISHTGFILPFIHSTHLFTADKYKQRSFGWVWIEALLNPDLESTFDVGGSGYPALIAANIRKSVYSSMRGPYSSVGIKDFVR